MIRYSTDVGWRFAGYLLRQYWPTINRKLQTAPEPETNHSVTSLGASSGLATDDSRFPSQLRYARITPNRFPAPAET